MDCHSIDVSLSFSDEYGITEHALSELRNPIIADVFDRLKLMERRGSGFIKILDSYEEQEEFNDDLRLVFFTDRYSLCGI